MQAAYTHLSFMTGLDKYATRLTEFAAKATSSTSALPLETESTKCPSCDANVTSFNTENLLLKGKYNHL
jgi:hypothetical protein